MLFYCEWRNGTQVFFISMFFNPVCLIYIFNLSIFKIHIFFISMIITEKMKIKISIPDG